MSGWPSQHSISSAPPPSGPFPYSGYGAAVPQGHLPPPPSAPFLQSGAAPPESQRSLVPKASTTLDRFNPPETEYLKGPALKGASADVIDLGLVLGVLAFPFGLFALTYDLMSFQPRFQMGFWTWIFVLILLAGVIAVGVASFSLATQEGSARKSALATWVFGLFIGLSVAWVWAVIRGNENYVNLMQPAYARRTLNVYDDVDPATMEGSAFMDAGSVQFKSGAKLDLKMGGGFMNLDMYCVAPIVMANATAPATYDFWAVGLNCCTGGSDFHCGDFLAKDQTMGGLRLMSNGQQEFYRLAVSQATGKFGVKARHPLFFHWVKDAASGEKANAAQGNNNFNTSLEHFAFFQMFLTVVTVVAVLWVKGRVK